VLPAVSASSPAADVALAELRQMVGDGAADGAAADDDDAGGVGKRHARDRFQTRARPRERARYQSTKCCTLVSRTLE
jgi:hypothetical protein